MIFNVFKSYIIYMSRSLKVFLLFLILEMTHVMGQGAVGGGGGGCGYGYGEEIQKQPQPQNLGHGGIYLMMILLVSMLGLFVGIPISLCYIHSSNYAMKKIFWVNFKNTI